MLNNYEYERAIEIGTKYINNEEKRNLVLIVGRDIKDNLLSFFDLKDIDNNNEEQLLKENLIICTLDEYDSLNEDLKIKNKCIVI